MTPGAKKTVIIISILFILFVIFSLAAIVYTERPKFCLSCHIMEPYYASWKKSAHKKVNCLKCHYEPSLKAQAIGKIKGLIEVAQYLSGKYPPRPQGEVSDSSCLRKGCHNKEALSAKAVRFKNTIEFNHRRHFGKLRPGLELKCTNCHFQLTSDRHIELDNNTCFICHFMNRNAQQIINQCRDCHNRIEDTGEHKGYIAEGLACTECHSDKAAAGAEVSKQVCYFCHADKEKIDQIEDKELLHRRHIHKKSKVKCINCHNLISH